MNVLVINCGSSSVKFSVIDLKKKVSLLVGLVDNIGLGSCFLSVDGVSRDLFVKDVSGAFDVIFDVVKSFSVVCVGHRVVHGGFEFSEPVFASSVVLKKLEKFNDLAPLHNPHNVLGVLACKKHFKKIPQVLVFDTAFHHSLSREAFTYSVPKKLSSQFHIRKYGFHGISHKYLSLEVNKLLKKKANIISCHLGNGASITCIHRGKSVDTSMGFTPLAGLVMGTRAGAIDPGLVLFLQEHKGFDFKDLNRILNKESGLLGLCGDSDMRRIYERSLKKDVDASLALGIFCRRVVHYIGAYFATMSDKTDALVFSGGIGENAFYVREKVCDSLRHLGVVLDSGKNRNNDLLISSSSSRVKVFVIPTNEELMIALDCFKLLSSV